MTQESKMRGEARATVQVRERERERRSSCSSVWNVQQMDTMRVKQDSGPAQLRWRFDREPTAPLWQSVTRWCWRLQLTTLWQNPQRPDKEKVVFRDSRPLCANCLVVGHEIIHRDPTATEQVAQFYVVVLEVPEEASAE